jgi:acid phosphatase type 7
MNGSSASRARRAGAAALTSAVVALGVLSAPVAVEASPSRASASLAATVGALRGTVTATASFHLVAVGDIAREGGAQAATAAVIAARDPQALLLLGDTAYDDGAIGDYAAWYDPSYGRFRSISWPLPGNHEYRTANAAGFRSYFGLASDAPTWWAKRAGAWLVIGLDSERVASADQQAFIQQTLAANDGVPTVVAWHRPRYSLGVHGDNADVQPLWALVSTDPDVRIALWGHDHDYERMKVPVAGRDGIQAFVVGTGGAELRPFSTRTRAWSWKRISGRYGVLHLRLRSDGWSWSFVRGDGVTADSGTRTF